MYDTSLRTRDSLGRMTSDPTGLTVQSPEEKRAYQRAWGNGPRRERLDSRQNFINLMKSGVGCADCGTMAGRLDFHHRQGQDKLFNISQRLLFDWNRLMSEIFKCDVLCAPCHTKRHWSER
jgi:hypothetical protein